MKADQVHVLNNISSQLKATAENYDRRRAETVSMLRSFSELKAAVVTGDRKRIKKALGV